MYENILTMDKAKTIEWVKLIDYDYSQNMVKVWLRFDSKKCYEMEFWKVKDLRSKFLIWKGMRMLAQQVKVFESKVWKGLGQRGWMDNGV